MYFKTSRWNSETDQKIQKHKTKKAEKDWGLSDSNQGPIDLQSNALPAAPSPRDEFGKRKRS